MPDERQDHISPPPQEEKPAYAAFNIRMGAAVIDSIFILVALIPVFYLAAEYVFSVPDIRQKLSEVQQEYFMLAYGGGLTQQELVEARRALFTEFTDYVAQPRILNPILMNYVFQITLVFGAVYFFLVRYGATPGKIILGLKVVRARDFAPPGRFALFLRVLGYLVSTIPLGLGFIAIAWNKKRQGWHDAIAGTTVIRGQEGLERFIPIKIQYAMLGIVFIIGLTYNWRLTLTGAALVLFILLGSRIRPKFHNPLRIFKPDYDTPPEKPKDHGPGSSGKKPSDS